MQSEVSKYLHMYKEIQFSKLANSGLPDTVAAAVEDKVSVVVLRESAPVVLAAQPVVVKVEPVVVSVEPVLVVLADSEVEVAAEAVILVEVDVSLLVVCGAIVIAILWNSATGMVNTYAIASEQLKSKCCALAVLQI